MLRKFINNGRKRIVKVLSKNEIKDIVNNDVDNSLFNQHCQQVADELNIDLLIVKEALIDNSVSVLHLIQSSILKKKKIKVNIFGYFSFQTQKIIFKINKNGTHSNDGSGPDK